MEEKHQQDDKEGSEGYVLGFTFLIIKDLVVTKYGKGRWQDILNKGGLQDDFLTHTKYSLELFNKLAGSCCEVLKMEVNDLLEVVYTKCIVI